MKTSAIDMQVLHRPCSESDGIIVHESYSVDFIVNGESLLQSITELTGGHKDFIGCFARSWINLNDHSKKQLLLLEPPETKSGRALLYLCPECGDIGCGAYGCVIRREDDSYWWSDFAYENGYEQPRPISGLGPFVFDVKSYEIFVQQAYAL